MANSDINMIQLNVMSNDSQTPEIRIKCEKDWNIQRLKQEIATSHPRAINIENQILFYHGVSLNNSQLITEFIQFNPNNTYRIWMSVIDAEYSSVFKRFLDLQAKTSKPANTTELKLDSQNTNNQQMGNNNQYSCIGNPYEVAYYYEQYAQMYKDFIEKKASVILGEHTNETPNESSNNNSKPPIQSSEEKKNEVQPEADQIRVNNRERVGLGRGNGRGIAPEEAREQNAIANALNTSLKLLFLVYIAYHYTSTFKFYLVVTSCVVAFIYQLGIFRINRARLRRVDIIQDMPLRPPQQQNQEQPQPQPQPQQQPQPQPQQQQQQQQEVDPRDEVDISVQEIDRTIENSDSNNTTDNTGIDTQDTLIIRNNENLPQTQQEQQNPILSVVNSAWLLLSNLILSFNPEHNIHD